MSNRASLIKQLISGEIVLMCVSNPEANTLHICGDAFAHNGQFVMTFNACIAVVMNRLIQIVFNSVITCIVRG